ncbi:MAG: LCP family protein [Terracoccus sp.]
MPTDRTPPSSSRDDAYVVDTRRRPKARSGAVHPTSERPSERSSGRSSATPPRPADDDESFVVDTRTQPRSGSGEGRPRPPRPERADGAGTVPPPPRPARPSRRRHRLRRVLVVVVLLLVASLAWLVWVPVSAWNSVARVDNVPTGQRPVDTSGYNYLLVGSDSRAGLTTAQRKALTTGSAEGQRTDTIMIVHVSESGGKPVMVSIPRDSYVPIPDHNSNKINAAYAIGGPQLLTATVEGATGIHLDGYVEIGLGGFADVVDSVGGVRLCVPRDMVDPKAGIDLKKGCQTLAGADALGYVRSRYEDPMGDIGRAARQRQFLGALMKKAATPSTVLLPWRYTSFADAAAGGIAVGQDTGLMDAVRVLQAMRSVSNDEGLSLSVPTSDLAYRTNNGLAVKWDTAQAKALFSALKNDEPLTEPPPGTTSATIKDAG